MAAHHQAEHTKSPRCIHHVAAPLHASRSVVIIIIAVVFYLLFTSCDGVQSYRTSQNLEYEW
jgi:hypothetical protein